MMKINNFLLSGGALRTPQINVSGDALNAATAPEELLHLHVVFRRVQMVFLQTAAGFTPPSTEPSNCWLSRRQRPAPPPSPRPAPLAPLRCKKCCCILSSSTNCNFISVASSVLLFELLCYWLFLAEMHHGSDQLM